MRKIRLISVLLVLLIILTGCENKEKNEENTSTNSNANKEQEITEINNNEEYKKEQKVEELYFTNASLMKIDDNALFEVTVRNESEQAVSLRRINIKLLNKDGNTVVELYGIIGDSINSKEEKIISSYYNGDIKEVTSVKYEIVR